MSIMPGNQALELVALARRFMKEGKEQEVRRLLKQALDLKDQVEKYSSADWLDNHAIYTEVLLNISSLYLKLGERDAANEYARLAQAWADDPNTPGSQRQFEESIRLQRQAQNGSSRFKDTVKQYLRQHPTIDSFLKGAGSVFGTRH